MPNIFKNIKKQLRAFFIGANYDEATQKIGAGDSGQFVDAHNMRHVDRDQDSMSKIGGEVVVYPAVNNACFLPQPYGFLHAAYECIGTTNFFLEDDKQEHIIEFWAKGPQLPAFPPYIRIDGVVVCMSADLPLTNDHLLQLDKNENCVGGEIYITDYNVPPMIFNLKDLMVNGGFTFYGVSTCTQKYFSEFNLNEYVIELVTNNNHPIFIQLTSNPSSTAIVVGSNGLKSGLYQYQIQQVTNDGDATAWSKATPLIPVIMRYSSLARGFPYTKTFGGTSADTSPYGIQIRFRVDNRNGYDYIRIKRTRYSDETAIGTGGVEKLLDFRLDISNNDLYVVDIFDAGALELDLPDEGSVTGFASITRAKTVRYYDSRLSFWNVEFEKRNFSLSFDELNGKRMFPVIQKITTPTRQDGHKNPYNFAYYRTNTRGEKYGFAVVGRDGNNQLSFAIPVPKNTAGTEDYQNYQMPNRRDACAPETIQFSNATVKAATTDGVAGGATAVRETHEVFDTVDSYSKANSYGINVIYNNISTIFYRAFNPSGQGNPIDASDTASLDYMINTQVGTGDDANVNAVPYTPKAFGLNYFSLGMAINAITGIPSYIKSFSVVRTPPANRVVAQGLGYYDLLPDGANDNKKSLNEFCFYSPDLDSITGINTQLLDEIRNNVSAGGTRYKVQMVSPLGFFTELYSAHIEPGSALVAQGIDMVNYVRILREDGSINPTDVPDIAANGDAGVGYAATPPDGFGYTGYAKWRHRNAPYAGNPFQSGGSGNQLFDIASIGTVSGSGSQSERIELIKLTTATNVYDTNRIPLPFANRAFNATGAQDFHEPMYIMNIIDTLAQVQQSNIQNYIETEHYQKTEALIGVAVGGQTFESFVLVDERNEDIANVIFINNKAWLNITGLTVPAIAPIVANIIAGLQTTTFNGVVISVYGVFQTVDVALTDTYSQRSVVFDLAANVYGAPNTIFMPDAGQEVTIIYDTAAPVKFFGGESTIGETLFAPYDLQNDNNGDPNPSQLDFSYPYPFLHYQLNNNYERPGDITQIPPNGRESVNFVNFLSSASGTQHARLRQIVATFSCESRVNTPFYFEAPWSDLHTNQLAYFPATHYIIRPWAWDSSLPPDQQATPFYGSYMLQYPSEDFIWGYGGFRFRPQTNIDYSRNDENHTATAAPKVGFKEITLFCTGGVWSLKRAENVIDSPGLRTFPSTNFYVLSDDTGDIKYAYDELTEGKGNNLWMVTESGVCLLITDKTLLYETTGQQLSAIGSSGGSNFISAQIWISKSIGMTDEFWRSAAEGYNVIRGNNSERRVEALFFSNKLSQYRLSQGALMDIARGANYHSRVFPDFLNVIGVGYSSKMSSIYDMLNDEYWACMPVRDSKHTVVFAERKEHYRGTFDYRFDKFVSYDGKTFGMRNAQTFLLDQYGNNINGLPVESILVGVSAAEVDKSKNFSRIDLSPVGVKPTKILFYPTKEDYLADTNGSEIDTTLLPLSLKNYGFWSGFIPRQIAGNRDRMQGQQILFVIKSVGNDRFKIFSTEIGYAELK